MCRQDPDAIERMRSCPDCHGTGRIINPPVINGANVVDLLSATLDEICRLRRAMAYEARVVEAHYEGYKTFPKTRRGIAEEQVARMRLAIKSPLLAYAETSSQSLRREAEAQGFHFLTASSWADELHLSTRVTPDCSEPT